MNDPSCERSARNMMTRLIEDKGLSVEEAATKTANSGHEGHLVYMSLKPEYKEKYE